MVYRLGGVGGFFQVRCSVIQWAFLLKALFNFSSCFQGLQARVLFQVPSTAICWSVYEFFKYFLTKNGLSDGGDGDKVTYEKQDTRMSGGSGAGYPINSLNDISSNSAIVGGVTLGAGHVLMKEDLLPTGSAASSALSAARALGAVWMFPPPMLHLTTTTKSRIRNSNRSGSIPPTQSLDILSFSFLSLFHTLNFGSFLKPFFFFALSHIQLISS